MWKTTRERLLAQCDQAADLCELYNEEDMDEHLLHSVLKTTGISRLVNFDIKLSQKYHK